MTDDRKDTAMTDDPERARMVRAIEATRQLEIQRHLIEQMDTDTTPLPEITQAFRDERDQMDAVALAIGGHVDELAEGAEAIATDLYVGVLEHLKQADQMLGSLRTLGWMVECWSELSQRQIDLAFDSESCQAVRKQLAEIHPPLPTVEMGERQQPEGKGQ